MQTLLPYSDLEQSAKVLESVHLDKQRHDCKEIYSTLKLSCHNKKWINHPVVRMWRGFEPMLLAYSIIVCTEWINRGNEDNFRDWFHSKLNHYHRSHIMINPPWMGCEAFHRSQRSNLVRKYKNLYSVKFEAELPSDLPYVFHED